ncbi:MAG: purine-nucleoside phosphorylase [Deltaproteobacteria bacterium]|nr:purine-nucleoside phosphorylase [Deltaproteobacteria bacterium]MBW2131256.1 purine-nucleoside phosphorylase [Deltaproteobacteria bacterium]
MEYNREQALFSADYIRDRIPDRPMVGLITGTGLGAAARLGDPKVLIPFSKIPGFSAATAPGQSGRLVAGTVFSVSFLSFEGRFHLYEGYPPRAVAFPVRVMQELGVGTLILANAAGGLNAGFSPGNIMIIADHLNLTGQNPLVGPNEPAWGVRFPDMASAYDPGLIRTAETAAGSVGASIQKGVYAGLSGPSLETPAEVRYLRRIGADAVGFSTVLETLAAVHAGMRVLGLSLITNIHDPEHPRPLTADRVIAAAKASAPTLAALIREILITEKSHGTL